MLTLDGVSAGYAKQNVLSDVNITLIPGQRIGVMGVNGAEKSTLFKLILGTSAREGQRIDHPRLNLVYFAQHQLENLDHHASPKVLLNRAAHLVGIDNLIYLHRIHVLGYCPPSKVHL